MVRPAAECVGAHAIAAARTGWHVDRVLAQVEGAVFVFEVAPQAVQVDRVRHHGVVDQHDAQALAVVETQRAGIGELNVAAQMQEMGLVRELVIANVGFSCCLLLNVTQDIAAGDMVELDVNLPPMYLDLRLARHKANGSQIDKFVAVVHKLELRT